MAQASKELGVRAVLAKRMVEQRLPKALALKQRVDGGALLTDQDLAFLEQIVSEAHTVIAIIKNNEQALQTGGRMLQLYGEITAKALENEKAQKSS